MATFSNIITESMKNALNRAVENHANVEARAKDVADWYMARKAEQEDQRRRESKEIDEMEREFISRYRNDEDFRDEFERLRQETEEDFRSGKYLVVGGGKAVLDAINKVLRFEVEEVDFATLAQNKADCEKYIKSLNNFANFK